MSIRQSHIDTSVTWSLLQVTMVQSAAEKPSNINHLQPAATSAVSAPDEESLRVPFYCEENVWRLLYRKLFASKDTSAAEWYAVFISNPRQSVVMYHQRAAVTDHVCWDYHVVAMAVTENEALVYDVDSHLPFPCALDWYVQQSFPDDVPATYAPLFRVVPALQYLQHFASDRRHMYSMVTRQFQAPPPCYACIQPTQAATDVNPLPGAGLHNLNSHYLDFNETNGGDAVVLPKQIQEETYGIVVDRQLLLEAFSSGCTSPARNLGLCHT
jgi:N-terminal glutamine amidase